MTVNIGDPVPPSRNPTLQEVGGDLERLTTDPQPDPAMYALSVAESVQAGSPLVVVLATPGFCETCTCGPMVDVVKSIRPEFADQVAFIHIEIADIAATQARGRLVYNRFMDEWRLPSEPWTFVVDCQGKVFTRYEGVPLPDELREDLRRLLATGCIPSR